MAFWTLGTLNHEIEKHVSEGQSTNINGHRFFTNSQLRNTEGRPCM
jgi:hypothetical protein